MNPKNKLSPRIFPSLEPSPTQLPLNHCFELLPSLGSPLISPFSNPMLSQYLPSLDFFPAESADPGELLGMPITYGEQTGLSPVTGTEIDVSATAWGNSDLSVPDTGLPLKDQLGTRDLICPIAPTATWQPMNQVYQPHEDTFREINGENPATIGIQYLQNDIDSNFSGNTLPSNIPAAENSLESGSALLPSMLQDSSETSLLSPAAGLASWSAEFTGPQPPKTPSPEAPRTPREIRARPGRVIYYCLKCVSPHDSSRQLSRHFRRCQKPFRCQVASCQRLLCDKRGLERHYASSHLEYARDHGFPTEKAKRPICSHSSLRADNVVRHAMRIHGLKIEQADLLYAP